MNKKAVALISLVCVLISGSKAFAKVGIKPYELKRAQELAKNKNQMDLYTLLGGQVSSPQPISFTQLEVNTVLWPVLVWAIEEGKVNLVLEIMRKGNITPNTPKPYGQRVTPAQIATFNKQYQLAEIMSIAWGSGL